MTGLFLRYSCESLLKKKINGVQVPRGPVLWIHMDF